MRTIRNALGWFLAVIFISLGRLNKAKRQSFRKDVIIPISFHNPNRKLFRRVVIWLRNNGYTFISRDQLSDILSKKIPCPRGAVWISFDDGWKDNIYNVVPVAVEYDVPVTIFVCTDAVETGTFWWQDIRRYSNHLPADYHDDVKNRRMPEETKKQVMELISRSAPRDNFVREALTIEDIKTIAVIPQVTIGSHTVSHPYFPTCSDTEVDYELGESKRKLEEWTGKPVRSFAYPSGGFSGRERRFLKEHGYELAVTVVNGLATPESDRYLLPRTQLMDDGSLVENLFHALGAWEPIINKIKHILR